jgi:hypothetical protein
LVEQHRPIDENLDPFAHWKKLIGLQKHAAAADIQRCGLNSISSQDVFGQCKDRVSLMLPTFQQAAPGLSVGVGWWDMSRRHCSLLFGLQATCGVVAVVSGY